MVKLTKISGETILINEARIEMIESIPESKIVMTSGNFYIVSENLDQIIEKVVVYRARIIDFANQMEMRTQEFDLKSK